MILQATHEKAGSVGAAWPPRYDVHNQRVKGFCPARIGSMADADRMFAAVSGAERSSPQATRTTVRAFVESGLVEGLRRDAPYRIEACFDAGNAMPGHSLVYFARNAPSRIPPQEVLESELSSVRSMAAFAAIGFREARDRIASHGYAPSRLNGDGRQEVSRLLELYQEAFEEYTFALSAETVGNMLSNGNIVIVGRDRESRLVSSLIAEHVELALDHGRTVHLYELSDYATFRAHRGKGLITLMQMEAINTIRAMPGGDAAIIYAEDRAAWIAVNKSSQKAGMEYCGTLLQHCVIVSDRDFGEVGRFENLNVWAHLPSGGA